MAIVVGEVSEGDGCTEEPAVFAGVYTGVAPSHWSGYFIPDVKLTIIDFLSRC